MRIPTGPAVFLLLAHPLLFFPARAQSPRLLGDLNQVLQARSSSWPAARTYDPRAPHLSNRFAVFQNTCFFRADDGVHGRELWSSTGTGAATALVKDIVPGRRGSSPWDFCVFQGKVFFSAWTPSAGREPWVSDGTAGGTRMAADLYPGPKDGGVFSPVVMGKSLYFFAVLPTRGPFALYRYDGGTKTPVLVKGEFALAWKDPVPAGKYIVFRGVTAGSGAEAWVTDGTTQGTFLIRDLNGVQSGECALPVAVGGKVWFCAMGASGWEIWSTSGGKALRTAALPFPGRPWSTPFAVGNRIVFGSKYKNFEGENPFALDTVTGKLILLKEITRDFRVGYMRPVLWKGRVWFSARDGTDPSHRPSLWRTDGTPAGTVKAVPEGAFSSFDWFDPTPGSKYLFFSGYDLVLSPYILSLWRTDGTKAGTLCLEKAQSRRSGYDPACLTPLGKGILFSGRVPSSGQELFASDGTPSGTGLVKDINPSLVTHGSNPWGFTGFLGRTWFWAATRTGNSTGWSLWNTDGTASGTKRVLSAEFFSPTEPYPGPFGIFFCGSSGGKSGLWRSDGTAGGTTCFFPWKQGWSYTVLPPLPLGDRILFAGWTAREGTEPWITDGTASGTRLLADTLPGNVSGYSGGAVSLGRSALFPVRKSPAETELWVTDGTPGGTRILQSRLVHAENLVRLGDRVLFEGQAKGRLTGKEPWVTDGTPGGTRPLADLYPGTGDGGFRFLFRAGDRVYFLGTDGKLPPGKYGLFVTDGTAAGTRRTGSFTFEGLLAFPRPWKSRLFGLSLEGRKALFWPVQGGVCRGPWITDGTPGGTRLLKTLPGSGWRNQALVYAWSGSGGKAIFLGPSSVPNGPKIWITDGTPGGTVKVDPFAQTGLKDYFPGAFSGGLLFLAVDTGITGLEPWALPLGAAAELRGGSCGPQELISGPPRLGSAVSFRILGLPKAGPVGIFLLGIPARLPLGLGLGQMFYLDPGGGILFRAGEPGRAGPALPPGSQASPAGGGLPRLVAPLRRGNDERHPLDSREIREGGERK